MNDNRLQIINILAFPVVLTIGSLLIPVVADYSDHRLSEQAAGQIARWFSGHIISAVGSVLVFLGAPVILSGWALYGVAAAAFGVFIPFALQISK